MRHACPPRPIARFTSTFHVVASPFMKRLFSSPDSVEIGLLKSRLEEAGIPCLFRNEQISQAIPSVAFAAELWIGNDQDYPRAVDLCKTWQHPSAEVRPIWTCPPVRRETRWPVHCLLEMRNPTRCSPLTRIGFGLRLTQVRPRSRCIASLDGADSYDQPKKKQNEL